MAADLSQLLCLTVEHGLCQKPSKASTLLALTLVNAVVRRLRCLRVEINLTQLRYVQRRTHVLAHGIGIG